MAETREYGLGEVSNATFQTLRVSGKGEGQYAIATATGESAVLAANGTLHRVAILLNKSTTPAGYKGPAGVTHTVRVDGVALWVDGALVAEAAASNGSASTLTDLRVRFTSGGNATWILDNIVVRNVFTQQCRRYRGEHVRLYWFTRLAHLTVSFFALQGQKTSAYLC